MRRPNFTSGDPDETFILRNTILDTDIRIRERDTLTPEWRPI
jgi:hypothetical protein